MSLVPDFIKNRLNGNGDYKVKVVGPILDKSKVKYDFKVLLSLCVHREIKVRTYNLIKNMEKCPNPLVTAKFMEGDALIERSRSRVATGFLNETDNDILFFLDDDIVMDTVDLSKMMWIMHKNPDVDILGGAYSIKQAVNPTFAIMTKSNGAVTFGKGGGLLEVRYVSTGCMGIKRHVFEKMIEESSNVQKIHPERAVHWCREMGFYSFFTPFDFDLKRGLWTHLSEDWAFCQRAMDLGFKVFCDTTSKLEHIGQYAYSWDDFGRPPRPTHESVTYEVQAKEMDDFPPSITVEARPPVSGSK